MQCDLGIFLDGIDEQTDAAGFLVDSLCPGKRIDQEEFAERCPEGGGRRMDPP
ncbi:MAG: hypothetical protein HY778_15305 [Betaproteobacteria bacterium]|nr:hypothetical protein [Betaproteobacteria bacterium]